MTTRLLPRALLLLGLLVALSPLGPTTGPAVASCAAPYLEVERNEVVEAFLEVRGRAFMDGCQDSMGCTQVGCVARCTEADPPPRPMADVVLTLRQRGRSWVIDEADADASGRITFTATLPPGARPGRAVLTTGGQTRTVVRLEP